MTLSKMQQKAQHVGKLRIEEVLVTRHIIVEEDGTRVVGTGFFMSKGEAEVRLAKMLEAPVERKTRKKT